MSGRIPAHIEVSGLIRRVTALGGTAALLSRGDRDAGTILLSLTERGVFKGFAERRTAIDGTATWHLSEDMVSASLEILSAYLTRRTHNDPDLWVVELDIVGVERFAAEMTATG